MVLISARRPSSVSAAVVVDSVIAPPRAGCDDDVALPAAEATPRHPSAAEGNSALRGPRLLTQTNAGSTGTGPVVPPIRAAPRDDVRVADTMDITAGGATSTAEILDRLDTTPSGLSSEE